MNSQQSLVAAKGITDADDRLLTADHALAELQENCGGSIPGVLAIPELLELVRQGRKSGLRLAREFSSFDGTEMISGFARVHPLDEAQGGGCEVLVENWHRAQQPEKDSNLAAERMDAIDRATAEIFARLDAQQRVQILTGSAQDTLDLQQAVKAEPGKVWTDYLTLEGIAHHQPMHWRLLDGIQCEVPGSQRPWRARLLPLGTAAATPRGFELLLVSDEAFGNSTVSGQGEEAVPRHSHMVGSALAPVLRQPVARIIANAETIRSRLAGPLRAEYSEYAGSISAAGQHLSSMLDDLADLEVVEAPGFSTADDHVDMIDAARRAAGILGVRAQDKDITVVLPVVEDAIVARGEFRRVLQILINLIGNAIAYSPGGSQVTVSAMQSAEGASVSVLDEGPGVSPEQALRIFEKFERLGRDSDGGNDTGSGLGLYISRKLALAMGGDLEVVQHDGDAVGAEFRLTLPNV